MQKLTDTSVNKQLLSRLCHLVALSESKKIESVVDSLVLSVVELDPNHTCGNDKEIEEGLKVYFGIQFDPKELESSLSRLITSGDLLRDAHSKSYLLSPSARAALAKRVSDAALLENTVKSEWIDSIKGLFVNWSADVETELSNCLKAYLTSLFRKHGAQTVLVVSGQQFDGDADLVQSVYDLGTSAISAECKHVDPSIARKAIQMFFQKQTPDRARYIAQLLDGTFSFYTLFTDEATQAYLKRAVPSITMFLDTNFLFGVLNLHDNPQNEVSIELVTLVKTQNLPFQLYYHEDSLVEMQVTIDAILKTLTRNIWPSGLSRAVLQTRKNLLSSVEIKFHEANAEHQIDPSTFFLRFRHIQKLLDAEGFKIYRVSDRQGSTKMDQKTSDLFSRYKRFLEENYTKYPKTNDAIKHDMTVWQAANALRHTGATGLDVGAIMLSADQRLFAFDWGVLRQSNGLGVVVLPSQLLQLLRPFIPRTTDFDEKFAEVFALPEFRSAHSDFSKVIHRVLQFLASIKGLNEETAASILADEVLMRRLRSDDSEEDVKKVIESEVLKKNEELQKENRAAVSQLTKTRREIEEKNAALIKRQETLRDKERLLSEREQELERERREKRINQETLARARQEAEKVREELASVASEQQQAVSKLNKTELQLSKAQATLASLEELKQNTNRLFRIAAVVIVTLLGWALLAFSPQLNNWQALQSHPHKLGIYLAAIILIPSLSWVLLGWKGKRETMIGIVIVVIAQLMAIIDPVK